MDSKIRAVQYKQRWCVYVHRTRAVQKGATQEVLGCTPPVRISSTSAFFQQQSSNTEQQEKQQHQHQQQEHFIYICKLPLRRGVILIHNKNLEKGFQRVYLIPYFRLFQTSIMQTQKQVNVSLSYFEQKGATQAKTKPARQESLLQIV